MRRFWQSDTALKIFSIICAVALWFYVIAAQNPEIEVKVKNIPVQVDSASEEALYRATGLSVVKPSNGLKTSLTVKGRRSVIGGVDNKNIKAIVDVSEIAEAGVSDPLTINIQLPESTSLYVMNIHPLQVSYSVEPRKYRSIPIEIVPSGGVSGDSVLHEIGATPKEIEVWGPESVINSIEKLHVTPDLSDVSEEFSIDCPFTAIDGNGKTVDLINVSSHVENVRVNGIMHQSKTLSLAVDSAPISAYTDLEVASVSVNPKRINIHGKATDVGALSDISVSVNFAEFVNEAGEQTLDAQVRFPQGIYCDELPEQISVTITLKESEKTE